MDNPASFRAAAAYQERCAVCRLPLHPWHAHHVVSQQRCRREGVAQHDPRDALMLCAAPISGCHWRHENGQRRVKLVELTDENVEFAVEALGRGPAFVYLTTYYAGEDPRVGRLAV